MLFPAVVKSLCNNVEVIKLINNYGHGVSYNLIEEIETEHALMVINEQKEKKVIIPEEAFQDDGSCCVGLMVADNIDNLECTLTGSRTSQHVNSILEQKKLIKKILSKRKKFLNQQKENVSVLYLPMLFYEKSPNIMLVSTQVLASLSIFVAWTKVASIQNITTTRR